MLETNRLILRSMHGGDAEDLLAVFGDPRVMASFNSEPFDLDQMKRWLERNLEHQRRYGYGLFAVILKQTGRLIGDCGLEHQEIAGRPEVELGYDFRSAHWNQGLATEAAGAVRDYALGELGLTRLVSLIREGNLASRRVAEKIGMALESTVAAHQRRYWLYALGRGKEQAGVDPG